jgi:hypothetical protein
LRNQSAPKAHPAIEVADIRKSDTLKQASTDMSPFAGMADDNGGALRVQLGPSVVERVDGNPYGSFQRQSLSLFVRTHIHHLKIGGKI